MEYENPKIPDGINTAEEHPLKEFIQLILGILALCLFVLALIHYSAGWMAQKIPFSYELELIENFDFADVDHSPQQAWLQKRADWIVNNMEISPEIKITVHYSEENIVNAFATLGGQVTIYQGLINQLESVEALHMILAHEIAHVAKRHPAVALGKGLTIGILVAAISGATGSSAGELFIGSTSNLALLKYSRDQESESDRLAVTSLNNYYGHVAGAKELFELFKKLETKQLKAPQFALSHPLSSERWESIEVFASSNGWTIDKELSAIPMVFQSTTYSNQ